MFGSRCGRGRRLDVSRVGSILAPTRVCMFSGGAGGKDVWVWIVRGTVDCLRTLPGLWIDEKPDSPGSRFDERSERG